MLELFLVVEKEYPLHHLPFFVACGIGIAALELADKGFPLGLAWECGESGHCFFPVEIFGGIYYHDQCVAQDVDFHLDDADFSDAVANFLPVVFRRMPFDVFAPCLFVGIERQRLYESLYVAGVLFLYVAAHDSFRV